MRRLRALLAGSGLVALTLALLVLTGAASAESGDMPAGMTPAALSYVALGDSITNGSYAGSNAYVVQLRNGINEDLHADTTLTNLGVSGWQSARLLEAVRNGPIFRAAIANADVVTVMIGTNDLLAARAKYLNQTCGGADNQDCFRAMVVAYGANLEAIVAEIRVLNTHPDVALLVSDIYYPALGDPATTASGAIYLQYLEAMNEQLHELADGYGYGVADVFEAYNGVDGLEDAFAKGYLLLDAIHPSTLGFTVIANEFRSAGYAPLDADGDGFVQWADNCPADANSDQANENAEVIDLPETVVNFDDYTNPAGDNEGDACDDDIDNDSLSNSVEVALGTTDSAADSDGDRVLDAAEVACGSDPLDVASAPAALLDGDEDGLSNACEAALGTRADLRDSDGDRLGDGVEAFSLGTNPLAADSDGDGCSDAVEMAAVNGDRGVRTADILAVFRAYGLRAGDERFIPSFDMNGDGVMRMSDTAFVVGTYGNDCP